MQLCNLSCKYKQTALQRAIGYAIKTIFASQDTHRPRLELISLIQKYE